jgi:hypothetical protein
MHILTLLLTNPSVKTGLYHTLLHLINSHYNHPSPLTTLPSPHYTPLPSPLSPLVPLPQPPSLIIN